GHAISWTVNGETVTASESSPRLQPIVLAGGGLGVTIGDQTVSLSGFAIDVAPRIDGICDTGSGQFVAVFGYDSTAVRNVNLSYGTGDNLYAVDGIASTNPSPQPPSWFLPGSHPGAFAPTFSSGQTVSWTVAGMTVTARADSTLLTCGPPTPGSNGLT